MTEYTAEIDPVTGYPREKKSLDTSRATIRLSEQKGRAELLKASLASETGQEVLRKIEEHLSMRIKKLMAEDPECKVLVKLLLDMGVTINLGDVAVQKLMKMVTK